MRRNENHSLMQMERSLAEDNARTALNSYGHPRRYLKEKYPGKEQTAFLRACWTYAIARGLIKVRRRNQFQLVAR